MSASAESDNNICKMGDDAYAYFGTVDVGEVGFAELVMHTVGLGSDELDPDDWEVVNN